MNFYRCIQKSLLPTALCLGLTGSAFAQEQKVSVDLRQRPLTELFSSIEKQTSYRFSYRNVMLRGKGNVSVSRQNVSTREVLAGVLHPLGLDFDLQGEKNIVIFNRQTSSQTASQANKKVRGTITDVNGVPVIGANVVVKGTTNGVITDIDGKFSIDVSEGDQLEVSYIGYLTQTFRIGQEDVLAITLKENQQQLDEVVVVGYMTQKKTSLTGSVATMKVGESLKTLPTTSAGNLLVGKLPGVDVGTANAIPGSNPSISIRTGSSWNSQGVTYVIDGIVRGSGDFNNLSPNEIESVTVLKDAASTAIYGSRAAGGVIVVTTKKGNKGKPTFNYSYGYSVDTRTKNVDLTTGVQAAEMYGRINGSADPAGWAWSQEEIDYIATINDGYGYNQLDEVWRNPVTQTHNLSVDGGSDKVRYFGAVSYVKQEGFLDPLTYDKFNFRMNVTANITDDFEIFTGLALYNNKQGNIVFEGAESLYSKLRIWQPDQPVYTESGQYVDYGWLGNVGAWVKGEGGYNKTDYIKPQMIVKGTYKVPFVKGLTASLTYAQSWTNNITKEFYKNYEMVVTQKSGPNGRIISTRDADITGTKMSSWVSKDQIEKTSSWSGDKQLNFQLSYDNTFNKVHHVSGTFVTEWYEGNGASVYGGREGFPVYLTDQFWAASSVRADTWGGGDTDWNSGRMSYIGQFNYSYANKYLLSFSFREDGSMNFAPNQRWGFFPAGSVGWVISEEKFFNPKWIQFLKVRGSVGLTGNDSVGGWQWQESYSSGSSAYFGTDPSRSVGITYGSIVNPDLTWEKALTYDVGVDMNFLNHWNFTFDYWFRNSYDILGNRQTTLPTTFSQSMPAENYGEIHAQGVEFELGYRGQSKDFTWHGNLTMSYGWNKTIKQDYAENAQWIDIPVGKSRSYISGYEFDRIIRTQEELDAFNAANPNYTHNGLKPELGMMVFKDLSGPDGTPDGTIDSWDRVMLYENNNPVVYGLNLGGSWKGLSLDLMFSGKLGIVKSYQDLAGGVEWNRMWNQWYYDSWTPETPNATLPKRISNNSAKTYNTTCSYWYDNGSFMRLKYLTLSYNLPKNQFYNKIFDNVRVYFTGTNLFVLSKFNKYYDPEISGGNAFPISRSFNFGVDVTF